MDTIDDSFLDLLTPVENGFEIQATPIIINPPKSTKILIPVNKKVVHKPIIGHGQMKKIGKPQILKVQSSTANGKHVILPYSFQSIKILNPGDLKPDRIHHVTKLPPGSVCRRKMEPSRHKEVKLTQEEKRLLDKEGIHLPAYHPLTKLEDRELKRIRRKIRNKISAQDSRKRKKEYVDSLEERVRRGSEDNRNLMQRVKELQKKNKTLMAHISKLQSLIFNTSSSKATPSTCLMIVMLSVLLVSLPNINLSQVKTDLSTEQEQTVISRSLLSTKKNVEDESFNMEEFFVFHKDENDADNENSTENEFFKNIQDMEKKYDSIHFDGGEENFFSSLVRNVKNLFSANRKTDIGSAIAAADFGTYRNRKGFIEPDIDEYEPPGDTGSFEPPAKRMKFVYGSYQQSDENFVPLKSTVVSATVPASGMTESKDI